MAKLLREKHGQAISNLGKWLLILAAITIIIAMYYAWFAPGNEKSILAGLLKTITGASPN